MAKVDNSAAGSHHKLRDELLRHGRGIATHVDAKHQEAAALLEQGSHELRKDKTNSRRLVSLFSEVALRSKNEFLRRSGAAHLN